MISDFMGMFMLFQFMKNLSYLQFWWRIGNEFIHFILFFVFSISSQESVAVGMIWVFHVSEALKLISWMEETRESFNKMLKQLVVAAQGFLVRICLSFPTINPWDNIWWLPKGCKLLYSIKREFKKGSGIYSYS